MSYEAAIDRTGVREGRAGSSRFWVLVLCGIAAAAVLRFAGIGSRALWLDEAYSAWFSALDWRSLWLDSPRYETHPPLYYSALKLWRALAGDDAGALRGLSALAGIAAVPVLALTAAKLSLLTGPRRPGLVIAFAVALAVASPRLLVIAQDARPYALLLLAYAVAVLAWLRLTDGFRRTDPEGRTSDWIMLGGATTLTLWLHHIGLLFATGLLAALLLTARVNATTGRWRRLVATVAVTALLYAPCVLMLLARSGDWSSGWVEWDPLRFPGALLDLYGVHKQTEVWTPIAARILFAALIALGLRAIWSRGDTPVAVGMAMLVLFPPLAAALLSQLGQPVFVPRTLVAVLAPAYILAALGLASLSGRRLLAVGGAGALILSINLAETLVRPSLEPWDEVAATIRRDMRAGDQIWVYPNDTALPLAQALGAAALPQPIPAAFPALSAEGRRPAGSPAVVAIEAAQAKRWSASQEAPARGTVWLLVRNPGLFDPHGEVERALGQGRRPGTVRQWRDLRLVPLQSR